MYKRISRFLKHSLGYRREARVWRDLSSREQAIQDVTDALCRVYWLRPTEGDWRTDHGKVLSDAEAARMLRVPLQELEKWLGVFRAGGAGSERMRYALDESRYRHGVGAPPGATSSMMDLKPRLARKIRALKGKKLLRALTRWRAR